VAGPGPDRRREASDHRRAREVLHRLEDHRMLYDPYEAERVQPVVGSAERLRDYLAEQIPQCRSDVLRDHLRDIQAAVRRCLTRIRRARRPVDELWPAVGELRSRVGDTAQAIAEAFDVPVNGDLAMIVAAGGAAVAAREAAFLPGAPGNPDGGPSPACPSCGVHDARVRWTQDHLYAGRSWWCAACGTAWTVPWPPVPPEG
jgi:hypothetical protein